MLKLTKKQYQAVKFLEDSTTTELLFGGAAGGGKSALGCMWLISMCTRYEGSRWLMGRSKLKTLKDTTLKTFFEVSAKLGVSHLWTYNGGGHYIRFHNGSEIMLKDLKYYPADPEFDELGSLELTGAFIDEANQITLKAKNIVASRIRYKLDEFGLLPKILMTCNPAKNFVYSQFYFPSTNGTLEAHRRFVQALLNDNKENVSKHYKENLLRLDEVSKQRLLYGNWEYDDDPSKLINYDALQAMWDNEQVNFEDIDPETKEFKGKKYITCDVARLGTDKTVIILWYGFRVKRIKAIAKSPLNEIVDIISEWRMKENVPLRRIIADEDGVGGGVVDFLRCEGFVNNSRAINDENFANLKSQCYFKLASVINADGVYIEPPEHRDTIIQELEQVKRANPDKDEKLRIIPKELVKENIGRSPDFSDALMMRMYFELEPERGNYVVSVGRPSTYRSDMI